MPWKRDTPGCLDCACVGDCIEFIVRASAIGCGCPLTGATIGLYLDDVLIDEQVAPGDGGVEWSSLTFPEIAAGGSWQIKVSDAPLYQDTESGVFTITGCVTTLNMIVAPVEGYDCSPCCTVPLPHVLSIDFGAGAVEMEHHEGFWGAFQETDLSPLLFAGGISYELSCTGLRVSVQCRGVERLFDTSTTPETLVYEEHYLVNYSGFYAAPFDCLGVTNISAVFPDDFEIHDFETITVLLNILDPPHIYDGEPNEFDRRYQADYSQCFDGSGTITIEELNPPLKPISLPGTETTGELCVTVVKLLCSGVGTRLAGITVEISSGGSPVTSGTTDVVGEFCATMTLGAGYDIHIEDADGCEADSYVYLPAGCNPGGFRDVTLELCCAKVRFLVVDDADDSPVPGAGIVGIGPFEVLIDVNGIADFDVSSSLLRSLPTVGGDCNFRLLPRITASKADFGVNPAVIYFSGCRDDVTVTCSQTAATVNTIRIARIPDGYLVGGCCLDDGCETTGPMNRGLVPEEPNSVIEIVTRDFGGSVTNTFRYTGTLSLDHTAFDASGVTMYDRSCIAPTIPPTYLDINNEPAPYLSCVVRVELCRAGGVAGRVRIRIFRGANCPGFTDWDSPPQPDDLDYDFELPEGVEQICYGEEIDEEGTFQGDNDTWSVSMLPT